MNKSAKEVMLKSFLHIKDTDIKKLEDEISIKSKQIMELESCIKTLNDELITALDKLNFVESCRTELQEKSVEINRLKQLVPLQPEDIISGDIGAFYE